jgi:branched-chain amino acid transport system ATP-binding protein
VALRIADRCLVMGHGQVVFDGAPAALSADAALRRDWLEV